MPVSQIACVENHGHVAVVSEVYLAGCLVEH